MNKSSLTPRERSRKTEAVIRNAINDFGRKGTMELLGISESQMAKFMSGKAPDCKINVASVSETLIGLGLKVVPATARICPEGDIPVPKQVAAAAWHNSKLGLDNLKEKLKQEGVDFGDEA